MSSSPTRGSSRLPGADSGSTQCRISPSAIEDGASFVRAATNETWDAMSASSQCRARRAPLTRNRRDLLSAEIHHVEVVRAVVLRRQRGRRHAVAPGRRRKVTVQILEAGHRRRKRELRDARLRSTVDLDALGGRRAVRPHRIRFEGLMHRLPLLPRPTGIDRLQGMFGETLRMESDLALIMRQALFCAFARTLRRRAGLGAGIASVGNRRWLQPVNGEVILDAVQTRRPV
jgi:hypothetical protein